MRERVELARLEAAGNQEVPGSLRGALGEDGSLDLDEGFTLQVAAHRLDDPIPQDEVALHVRAAQIYVAVLEAQGLVHLQTILGKERGRLGGGQHLHLIHGDLYRAGGHVGVDALLSS